MLSSSSQPDVSSGLPLGMIIPSAVAQTDAGLHLLDGTQLSKTGAYAQFCTWLTAKYNADSSSVPTCTETQWQNEVTATGQCGKFVITSTTVRLPKITKFIEGLNSLSDLAKREDAGVPNITSKSTAFSELCVWSGGNTQTVGAIRAAETGYNNRNSGGEHGRFLAMDFDASRQNIIYGNSTTVQPQAVRYPYYIVVATILKTQIQVDLDQYVSDLNLKADKDLANSSVPHIVKTFVSGTEGYRIWSDGYCEQWGILSRTHSGAIVVFAKRFATTPILTTTIATDRAYSSNDREIFVQSVSATQFVAGSRLDDISAYMWKATGYLAVGQY